jgi:hypothetical protein
VSLIRELEVRSRESQIDLRDEIRGIQRVGAELSSQVKCGEPPELVVHERGMT